MTCEQYKEQITLLASGALPESERSEVERHVSACESCRSEYEALRKLCYQIQGLAGEDDKAEAPVGLSERLEERFVAAAGASISRRNVWRLAIAAAACVLIGLAVCMFRSAAKGRDRIRQGHEAVGVVASTPDVPTKSADLPRASGIVYYRAWLQSPDALDYLLTRDAAILLRPEPIQTKLDVNRILENMNPIKEEHNEKHSMRGCASGASV